MLGKNTETNLAQFPPPSTWKNAGFDWTGDLLQIKAKFMAQAEMESELCGFQAITLIWLSYSEGNERLWVQAFLSIWVRKLGHNLKEKAAQRTVKKNFLNKNQTVLAAIESCEMHF